MDKARELDWIERNTFRCDRTSSILSPEACAANRAKPRLGGGSVSLPPGTEGARMRASGYMPMACEGCAEWQRLCREVEERRKTPGAAPATVEKKEEVTAMGKPTKMGICLECKKHKLIKARGLCDQDYGRLWANGTLDEKYPSTRKPKKPVKLKSDHKQAPVRGIPPTSIDFSLVPGLRECIEDRAAKQIRTFEEQIIYDLARSYPIGEQA